MKKKVVSLLLTAAMTATIFAGCGKKSKVASDGKVFNIYCWNEEFKSRVTDHYPGYEAIDGTTGKIGKVTVKWHITANDALVYQTTLDEELLRQADKEADEKIDMFLCEADYAKKYINADVAIPVKDLGIKDSDVANQYKYTKDVVTDADGNLKGLSWQAAPGVIFFNRDIALEVLGTDDATKVQAYLKDWATFYKTADTMKEKGYKMTASVNDSYRAYSNNVSTSWVDANDKITIDPNIMKWVDDCKKMVDKGETNTAALWSDDWKTGFFPEGKVFCYFGPAWLINFCMAKETEGSVANLGKFNAAQGPQGFFWGGTWMCGAKGTDNGDLIKDIMMKLCVDEEIMTDIVKKDDDFVNNKPAMDKMAKDTTYKSAVLGGANPLSMYIAGVEKIDLSLLGKYDQACNESFQEAMKNYFDGNATKDEALELFYKAVIEKHPNLKK